VIAIGLLAIAAYAAAFSAPALAAGPSVDRPTARRLIATVQQLMRKRLMPGAIVGIQRGGRPPWIIARGVANLQTRSPMRTDEHVRIGSITKTFVTTRLLQLAQQHRLSLDDPISRYVAGVPNGDAITLRELSNMTSGLAELFDNPEFGPRYYLGDTFTPIELVDFGLTLPPLFAPGTGWSYSNTNTDLLGLVIEKVTGQSLAVALGQGIFRPLGLRGSSLPSTPKLPRPFPHGYTVQTPTRQLADATFYTTSALWAAGGMVSTVRDLLRAAPMFGTGRPLLSAATQRERTKWVQFPPNSPIQEYGIGLLDFNGWIGHNGGLPGFGTIAWYFPRQRLSLVVSVNSDIGPKRTGYTYQPASEIGHYLTRILTPHNVAPIYVKGHGSPVTTDG
jgi:D-alanyl-D-alanine carboxypeptidase